MLRKIAYWGTTGLVGIATLCRRLQLSDRRATRRSRTSGTWDIRSSCVSCSA